jgi:putative PEP-CTERM system histidine kinase
VTLLAALPFLAGILAVLLAVFSVLRQRPSPAAWCFCGGMALVGFDSLFTGLSLVASRVPDTIRWLALGLIVKSCTPAAWLGFSLAYSRGDARAALARWRPWLAAAALVPLGVALGFRDALLELAETGPALAPPQIHFGVAAMILNVFLLIAFALALMNLEQTFRAAVGTMRWRIKYVVLGLAVILGGHLYVRSQAILFSAYDAALTSVESLALLIGCGFLAVAYTRAGFAEADVYPSRAVLRSSLTVLFVGGYLFIVGVLAQVAARLGGAESFQFQAFVVLFGMAGLATLLLSDRLRRRAHDFVVRHFGRARHDSVRIWTGFSRRLVSVRNETDLCRSSAQFVSETFDVLSVAIWLLDEGSAQLAAGASTARQPGEVAGAAISAADVNAIAAGLRATPAPFDLDAVDEPWAGQLRQLNPSAFPATGGRRWCVPLIAGERCLGAIVLADRVEGAPYSVEDLELLSCIGAQVTSVLLNLRLADEVARSKELEAFQTMSAFFVHDLKNAAASLNLMLKNLPVHFDSQAFRADALRGIGNAARRVEDMIAGLSALRQRPVVMPVETDLNQLVAETIEGLDELRHVSLSTEWQPLPRVLVDREQLKSVVVNLLMNARDALDPDGRIAVRTDHQAGQVVLVVADTGCGMSEAFIRDSLFRPFQSTKKHGLGIGMFQARMIVEAHGGLILVQSEAGKGTTIRVSLPART